VKGYLGIVELKDSLGLRQDVTMTVEEIKGGPENEDPGAVPAAFWNTPPKLSVLASTLTFALSVFSSLAKVGGLVGWLAQTYGGMRR
jgi:hypothetical protein